MASGAEGDRPALFGELLRRHRAVSGLTQEELAERAGLSVRGLRYLERGLHRPYQDTVQRLLEVLHAVPGGSPTAGGGGPATGRVCPGR